MYQLKNLYYISTIKLKQKMITQTYTFRDLPKPIRENRNDSQDIYLRGIQSDLSYEFETCPPTLLKAEMDVTGHDLLVTFSVDESDARFLEIVLHNLHSGKLLND